MNERAPELPLALAATAEAGVFGVVVHLLLEGAGVTGLGLGAFLLVFWIVFTAGALLVWRARGSDLAGPACVVAAVAVGLLIGRGTLQTTVVAVMICVVVAMRIATLALRDWRELDAWSLWVGGVAVGLEALAAGTVQRSWGGALVVVVPVFFAAALASRAAVVWADQDPGSSWVGRSGRLAAGLGLLALAAVLAGGTIDRLAALLAPAGRAVVGVLAWGVSQLLRPVFWAFERANVDTRAASDLLERIRLSSQQASRAAVERADPNGGGGGFARIVALLFLVSFTLVAIRIFRRIRAAPSRAVSPLDTPVAGFVSTSLSGDDARSDTPVTRGRRHRSADGVRRAYGEVLDALGENGLVKPVDLTPGEFAREVADRHPEMAEPFDALTRAYEDVRYGAASLPMEARATVEALRRSLLATVRRLPPPAEA